MSNAAGRAFRRPSQDRRGLWYVATGNARQMAALRNVERYQHMHRLALSVHAVIITVVRICERNLRNACGTWVLGWGFARRSITRNFTTNLNKIPQRYDRNVRKGVCLMLYVSTDGTFCNILSTTRVYSSSSVILEGPYD
jgi:hypothetical protein